MSESVKLMRCPIDTNCANPKCPNDLPFGVWVYYNSKSSEALCIECGIKRGWMSKQRVKQLIRRRELQEDIKALGKQRKIEADTLVLLMEKIDLHRLGERDLDLEKQIVKLMKTVQDYLKHCGTPKEKEALDKVFDVIRQTQELQRDVRSHVQNELYRIERKDSRIKKKQPVLAQ